LNIKFSIGTLSNILTAGGTILGTSRDVPHNFEVDGKYVNRVSDVVDVYNVSELDALVCIGGQETQEAALHLSEAGLNVLTLPKSADNDVAMTDVTIGFDTARMIATEAVDRLHSTANSTHRIIIVEIMGREVGWLTLGAGIASGSDVILIPEIPFTPSASDRLLATYLGTKAADLVAAGEFGKMVAYQDGKAVCVPLADVVGKKKQVPIDHPWIISARHVGTVFGD